MSNKEIVFVTNNQHKLREIKHAVGTSIKILSLKDIGFKGEIDEPYETLKENAMAKVDFIVKTFNCNCFADDTGLMIDALNGAPGVYSARYAGDGCTPKMNILKVMHNMKEIENRSASFSTVIALYLNGNRYTFEGKIEGKISKTYNGQEGFGYDPIFIPNGYEKPFSEFNLDVKNSISHRGKAVKKLINFLDQTL